MASSLTWLRFSETVARLRTRTADGDHAPRFLRGALDGATYMIAGRGTPDQRLRVFSPTVIQGFRAPSDAARRYFRDYLVEQIDAGADAVQIFDSWAGVLGEEEFQRFAIEPVRRMIASVRRAPPLCENHRFREGCGPSAEELSAGDRCGCDRLDWSVPLSFAAELQKDGPVQGNLDPVRVVAGGAALEHGTDRILDVLGRGPLIFNLGHGITPDADPDHVPHSSPAFGDRDERAAMRGERQTDSVPGKRARPSCGDRGAAFAALLIGLFAGQPDDLYLWIKALHIIAVISWMAALLYMPVCSSITPMQRPDRNSPRPSR